MRVILAFVLLLVASPVRANECPAAMYPVQVLVEYLNANNVTASFQVPEPNASAVVAKINSMEPKTDWKADRVVVYYDQRAAMLVIHVGECFASPGPMPHSVLEGMLREAAKGLS